MTHAAKRVERAGDARRALGTGTAGVGVLRSIAAVARVAGMAGVATVAIAANLEAAPRDSRDAASAPGSTAVHVCLLDGVRRYGDRPCPSDARSPATITLAVRPTGVRGATATGASASPGAGGAKPARASGAPARTARATGAASAAEREAARGADRCRQLRRRLERVDDALRAGYGAAEGERLKRERRELREDLGWHRCR